MFNFPVRNSSNLDLCGSVTTIFFSAQTATDSDGQYFMQVDLSQHILSPGSEANILWTINAACKIIKAAISQKTIFSTALDIFSEALLIFFGLYSVLYFGMEDWVGIWANRLKI